MLTTWQSALDYIYSLTNFETRPPGTTLTFELDRARRLLAALDDPHQRWPALHVGGTNGKGSTCAMLAAILRRAGYRVGLYTSPHLHTVRERVQVDGELISEAEVLAWLNARRPILDAQPGLTTFELLTALAFDHFAAREVDVAVIEVGLGGRLDTTNVVRPALTVITPIGLDHTKLLGDTVAEIARDKAGIFKPGVPAVIAYRQDSAAAAVLAAEAEAVGAPLVALRPGGPWPREESVSEVGQVFRLRAKAAWLRALPEARPLPVPRPGPAPFGTSDDRSPPAHRTLRFELWTALVGSHQRYNAGTAVAAAQVLSRMGWPLTREMVEEGLHEARWPARCEAFPLTRTDALFLLVDGAHNPHAARALDLALREIEKFAVRHFILGFTADKDAGGIIDRLLVESDECDLVRTVIVTQSAHPRAMPAEAAADLVRARGIEPRLAQTPADALEMACVLATGGLIVATGSIFLAAEVRMAWFQRSGADLPPHDPPRPPITEGRG